MKIDILKLKAAGFRNLRASVELLSAIETIERFIPPEEKTNDVIDVPAKQQKLLTNGTDKAGRKKVKMTPARLARLRKNNKKAQRILANSKRPCAICGTPIDPRVHSRHEAKCKRLKAQGKVHPLAKKKGIRIVEVAS